jgi:hypothetical protein
VLLLSVKQGSNPRVPLLLINTGEEICHGAQCLPVKEHELKRRKNQGGEMNQALYAHMNNKRKMKKKKKRRKNKITVPSISQISFSIGV